MTPFSLATRPLLAVLLLTAAATVSRAQEPATRSGDRAPAKISDNSFLVEEGYNQEAGVVQHISTYRRTRGGSWLFSFTQEWPASSQRHQLSYTVPLASARDVGTGVVDVTLNYRYQALGRDEQPLWLSPRLSLVLPAGSVANGRGAGGPGLQVMLPLSIDLTESLVTHWNAGGTLTRSRSASGVRATTRGVGAAASAIWLLRPNLNLMLETAWDRGEVLDDGGARGTAEHFIVLPGVRAAINLASGMQIVPGIGVPIGLGPSRGDRDLFLYFSVEHSFR
jgi:hypothetical protein